jgi:hypothetical protein
LTNFTERNEEDIYAAFEPSLRPTGGKVIGREGETIQLSVVGTCGGTTAFSDIRRTVRDVD